MLKSLLLEHLQDPESSWSCGRFGAIAEFRRDPGEPVTIAGQPVLSAATARGAIRIDAPDELRPVAYETISKWIDSWGHGIALCLPRERARMNGRTVITELVPDREAVRAEDRESLLFDLGLDGGRAEICVRTSDAEAIRLLRAASGKPLFDGASGLLPRLPALSPQRVFISALGRIEVYQPIPPPRATRRPRRAWKASATASACASRDGCGYRHAPNPRRKGEAIMSRNSLLAILLSRAAASIGLTRRAETIAAGPR